jgi:hypothetical protein
VLRLTFTRLHERIVDSGDVGSDKAAVSIDVADLQALVSEAIELCGEITAHIVYG